MDIHLTTPEGDSYSVEGLAAGVARLLGESDPAALHALRLALDLDGMGHAPEVVALMEAMLRSPGRASSLLAGASAINRLCIDRAIALVYCAQNPATGVRVGTGAVPLRPALH